MSNENQTKTCKFCQSEIPKKAKVCPNCRKKQGGLGKWIIIAVIVLVLIGAMAGGGSENEETKPADTDSQSVETVENSEAVQDAVQEEEQEVSNEFSVGDIVETSDLKISYLSAEEYVSDNEFLQPEDGNVYYKMEFEFENIGKSDAYVSSFDFNCYADGYDMAQSYLESMDLDATLSAGKKTKGSLVFEVPEDAESVILEYETNFWTEDKIVFVVK